MCSEGFGPYVDKEHNQVITTKMSRKMMTTVQLPISWQPSDGFC
jgi:hypothetical protein